MKNIFYLLTIFLTCNVWVGKYPVLVITGVSGKTVSYYTKVMEIGSASDQIPPANYNTTLLFGATDKASNAYVAYGVWGAAYIINDGVKTIGELAMEAYNASPDYIRSGTKTFGDWDLTHPPCMTWGSYFPTGFAPVESIISPTGCMVAPPSDNWCKITSPEIILDHGTLSSSASEGDVARATMDVDCGVSASVQFTLPGGYIILDEGKSSLKVDDKPLGSKVDLPQGKSTLKISDSLEGVTSEGVHTGTSVLIMQPY